MAEITILSWQPALTSLLGISNKHAMAACDWLTDGHWPVSLDEKLKPFGIDFKKVPPPVADLLSVTTMFAAAHYEEIVAKLLDAFGVTEASFGGISEAFSASETHGYTDFPWLAELAFFLGSSLLSLGRISQAESLWACLRAALEPIREPAIATLHRDALLKKIDIERGVTHLNLGNCHRSREQLEFLLLHETRHLGSIAVSRGLAALTVTYIQLRDFKTATRALEFCRKATAPDTSTIHLGIVRLEVMLAIAEEDYDRAADLLSRAKPQTKPEGRADLLFKQQSIRLALLRNNLREAEDELSELIKAQTKTALSKAILNPAEERFELEIRASRTSRQLVEEIESEVEECIKRGDRASELRLKVLKAATKTSLGQEQEAFESLEQILNQIEDLGLYGDLADGIFHALGAAFRCGEFDAVRHYLIKGSTLTKLLGLSRRKVIFSYLRAMCNQKKNLGPALAEVLKSKQMSTEINYFMDHYGILGAAQFNVSSEEGTETLSESALRMHIWNQQGFYLFRRENLLVVHAGHKISAEHRQTSDFFVEACHSLARNAAEGLSLEDFHKLKSRVTYHKLRHSGAARTALHRLNSILDGMGVPLKLRKKTGKYRLPARLKVFQIEVANDAL